ncbi:MAG: hypothetical protein AAF611_01320 [Bacteroidota bacterium]
MKTTNSNSLRLNKKSITGFNSFKKVQNLDAVKGGYADANYSSVVIPDEMIM